MLKTSIWLAGFLAALPTCAATLSGIVYDPAQQPITGARVVISNRAFLRPGIEVHSKLTGDN